MDYSETLRYIMSALPMFQREGGAAYKANLDDSHALDLYDGSPHQNYHCVHIAGTNGKGSVAHMLANILRVSGYRVGLMTSPHLVDFRERIRVDGEMIEPDFITEYIGARRELYEELQPSFFEMAVALGFAYFAEREVDIAVIEVGMGGRLDSTNIIHPLLSIITSLGRDHTQFLGDTLELIAHEKAGIIKRKRPVVIGDVPQSIQYVFKQKAREEEAYCVFANREWTLREATRDDEGQHLLYESSRTGKRVDLHTDLTHTIQQKNLATILSAVEMLRWEGLQLPWDEVKRGLQHVATESSLYARWQVITQRPLTILDIAHNEEAVNVLLAEIDRTPHQRLHWVLGFSSDKNVDNMLRALPRSAAYYFTQASVPRALPAWQLAQKAESAGLEGQIFATPPEALAAAQREAAPDDLILVAGSAFLSADILAQGREPQGADRA